MFAVAVVVSQSGKFGSRVGGCSVSHGRDVCSRPSTGSGIRELR